MNEKVASEIRKGTCKNLFLLQVDNVCNHGLVLASVLRDLADKRLLNPQQRFDNSSIPLLTQPHTASLRAASALLLGGFGPVSTTAVALRRGFTGRRSSAVADFAIMPIHGEE